MCASAGATKLQRYICANEQHEALLGTYFSGFPQPGVGVMCTRWAVPDARLAVCIYLPLPVTTGARVGSIPGHKSVLAASISRITTFSAR